jgi:hypothetical protein
MRLASHPIPVMGGLVIVGLMQVIGSAMLLDQQAAERERVAPPDSQFLRASRS